MPRINLLKPKIQYEESTPEVSASISYMEQASRREGVDVTDLEIFLQALAKVCILFLIPVFLFFYERQSISKMEKSLQHFMDLKSSLESSISSEDASLLEEIKEASVQKERLQKQIAWIERIHEKRFAEIKILELVQNNIPSQSWLTEVHIENNNTFLKGATVQDSDIHHFINSLLNSILFTNVQLVRAEKQISTSKVTRKSFEIQCEMESRL